MINGSITDTILPVILIRANVFRQRGFEDQPYTEAIREKAQKNTNVASTM